MPKTAQPLLPGHRGLRPPEDQARGTDSRARRNPRETSHPGGKEVLLGRIGPL